MFPRARSDSSAGGSGRFGEVGSWFQRSPRAAAWSTVAILTGLLAALSLSAGALGSFSDDDDSVHRGDIEYLASRGITKGCNPPENSRFCPERPLTRGEMAAFLVRVLDLSSAGEDSFGDDNGSVFEGDINAVAQAGISTGCNPPANDRFCPYDYVSRGQMAAFLTRALGLDEAPDFFGDDGGSVFERDINAIALVGLTRGCNPPDNTRYCPNGPVTRGQMATYLMRADTIETTGTTTTTPPPDLSGAIRISPGQDIQKVVDSHGSGSTFLLEKGVHSRQQVAPREGDRFVGESGAILDGEGAVEYAFGGGGDNVVIENLIIRNYDSHSNTEGALRSVGGGLAWTIRNNEIHGNEGAGIQVNPGWRVINNHIHHNSHVGIIGGGSGIVIEGNEISHNNPDGLGNPHIDAGGAKFFNTTDLVVRNNHSHHNRGPGLWTDGGNVGALYEDNLVEANDHAGIKHEISCRATIRDNTAIGNGFDVGGWVEGAGILVMNSPDVTIEGNTVRNNHDGIGGVQTNRTTSNDKCANELRNLVVRNNTIEMTHGQTGIASNDGSAVFTSWGNQFHSNTYELHPSNGQFFDWMQLEIGLSQWQDIWPNDG